VLAWLILGIFPAEAGQQVLVIIHGIRETAADMTAIDQAAVDTGNYAHVVRITYDWAGDVVPNVAPAVFHKLTQQYPGATFDLYGYSKGGLVAEWITERDPEADGRIETLITVDSPLAGAEKLAQDISEGYDTIAGGVAPYSGESSRLPERSYPGLAELEPGSPTLKALVRPPINDLSSVMIVRVWGQDDAIVERDSALRSPPGDAGRLFKVIAVSSKKGTTGHSAMRDFLAQHTHLFDRLLSGQLPPEAQSEPIEMSDERVSNRSQLPSNWVPCQCPDQHAGLGIWIGNTMYHDPAYFCPK
jgi:pimeloyl-ACP methyl ester carboxylesterase